MGLQLSSLVDSYEYVTIALKIVGVAAAVSVAFVCDVITSLMHNLF